MINRAEYGVGIDPRAENRDAIRKVVDARVERLKAGLVDVAKTPDRKKRSYRHWKSRRG